MTHISIETIQSNDIPAQVARIFHQKTDIIVPHFERHMYVDTGRAVGAYAVQIHARERFGEHIQSNTFIADVNEDEQQIGYGFMMYQQHGYEDLAWLINKPFVASTETDEGYRKQGLGTQRLKVMNALAHELHGASLHSDHHAFLSDDARSIWRKLVREGLALQYAECDGSERYTFVM